MLQRACKCRCRPTDCADGNLNHWDRQQANCYSPGSRWHRYTDPALLSLGERRETFIPQPEPRYGTKKQPRCWDISVVKSTLGSGVCNNIRFVHAFLGCDTTSYVYGFGKSAALKLLCNNKDFDDQAKIFANPNSAKADVITGDKGTCMPIKMQIRWQLRFSASATLPAEIQQKNNICETRDSSTYLGSSHISLYESSLASATVDGKPESAATNRVELVRQRWTLFSPFLQTKHQHR